MKVLVDTSAFLAIIDQDDPNHVEGQKIWQQLIIRGDDLICTNYTLVETIALLQRRFGMAQVNRFQTNVARFLNIVWIDERLHEAGVEALLLANRRQVSFVDSVNFITARQAGIDTVFAFDWHFNEQGFRSVSSRLNDTGSTGA